MPALHEIRADFDATTITVYQAYAPDIALPAAAAGRFVPPFSRGRMTWIKPSFLWMMERCGWGQKPGQERVLAVRITRAGWETALSLAALTHPDPAVYADPDEWRVAAEAAPVRVQWDPERDLRGGKLAHRSIQVGLGREVINQYADEWTVAITDLTPQVRKMHDLVRRGETDAAKRHLPPARVYPVSGALARRLGMG